MLVSRIHARPLDRTRPLWEIYLIEGLDKVDGFPRGCFAMLSKIHHATIDGASGGELAAALHELEPDSTTNPEFNQAQIKQGRNPGNIELLARANLSGLKYPLQTLRMVRSTIPNVARTAVGLFRGKLQRIKKVPRTRFNGVVSPNRVFNSVRGGMGEILAIKKAVPGVTVNDIALSIVGGGLRHYLNQSDDLPELSMVAAAPINLRASDADTSGNEVSNMSVKLRTDVADPMARLIAVHEGTQESKAFTQAIGASTMTNFVRLIPSFAAEPLVRTSGQLRLTQRMPPVYNCSVTNVPGPRQPLYMNGAEMLISYGMGPVMDGVGLFNIINSYCNEFSLSFTCCREMMPDPDNYAACLARSFEELKIATL